MEGEEATGKNKLRKFWTRKGNDYKGPVNPKRERLERGIGRVSKTVKRWKGER